MRLENTFVGAEGVGETTERRLWESGVTRWSEFDGQVVGTGRAASLRSFIDEARDRLAAGDAGYFADALPSGSVWRCYRNFRADAAFFDIETTGLSPSSDDVTTVSVHRGGETTTLVRGDDLTGDALADLLGDVSLLVTYNGKRFDVPFLAERFDVPLDGPHLDLLYPCRRLGLTGGLKAVEGEVGVERDRPDLSGRDAIRLWREHQAGADGALDTLVSYNQEDAANLVTVADEVCERLRADVLGDCDAEFTAPSR